MVKKTVRSAFVTSIVLAVVACNNNVPNNVRNGSEPYTAKENFQDLDKEYQFSTKALTQSYLKRKLDKWLGLPCDVTPLNIGTRAVNNCNNVNGPKLVKEISYARFKHPDTFCAIINQDITGNLLSLIESVQEVQNREAFDAPFKKFVEGCKPAPTFGPLGKEIQANTFTTGSQYSPSVAMDGAGDFVVTWQSYGQTGNNFTVYAQRYNADGSKPTVNGSEFRVNTNIAGNHTAPKVAMDNAGDFVITWQSGNNQDGSGYGIFAQRYDSSGLPQGSEFLVNTTTAGFQSYPSIAMDNAGDFVVTWQSYGPGEDGYGVLAQRYNSDGSKPAINGSEFQVNTYTTGRQNNPKAAMDSAGDFVITWQSYYQDGNSGIYAQRYNPDGSKPAVNGSEFQVNTATGFKKLPTAAMDSAGDFVISWQSFSQDGNGYGVFAQRYNSDGSKPDINSSEFQVNTYTTGDQKTPAAAMDISGDFVVVWNSYGDHAVNNGAAGQDGSYAGVFAQRYNTTGDPQ